MRLLKWHDTSTYTYLASTKYLFVHFMNWKWDSPRFMKLLVGEYRAFVEHLFVILAVRKSFFYRDVKSSNRGTLSTLLDILAKHKKVQESLGSKILCFHYFNLQHFEGLKLRILNCPEIFGSRLYDYRWAIFGHFHALKMPFCLVVGPWAQGYIASS